MTQIESSKIRNIALVGHEGAGETTLLESILKEAGAINRMGHVKDHNTVSDFDPDEKGAEKSYSCSTVSFPYKNLYFNLLDVPGSPDLIGEALTGLHAVESALVCVDATGGIKANTRKTWKVAAQLGLPRIIAITRLDADNTDFWNSLDEIKKEFGNRCIPLYIPDGSGASFTKVFSTLHDKDVTEETKRIYDQIVESIVETDDELMERYLEGEEIGEEDLIKAFKTALLTGSLFPVMATAAEVGIGTKDLLHILTELAPGHNEIFRKVYKGTDEVPLNEVNGFVGYVYKTASDEFVTRVSYVRVLSGTLATHAEFINRRSGNCEKLSHMYKVFGKEHTTINMAVAGDLIAIPRVADMHAGDVITDSNTDVTMEGTEFPVPMVSVAVRPKTRKDEQKISSALKELENDDGTFHVHRDTQTGDLVISGMSDAHLKLMLNKLKRRQKVDVEVLPPKIPYKETITKMVKHVEYTHKKQSGGAGQYGKVIVDIEPLGHGEGYEFVDKIHGGVIDAVFRSSVDKGVQAKMAEGILSGHPVTDVRVILTDGKTHSVDSKDIAFQVAGREVFKKAFLQCDPVLLEPIVQIEVNFQTDHTGDIIGDLNSRRSKILSSDNMGSSATVKALVPLAEVQSYQAQLKSITSGEGSYSIEFDHYDYVPPDVQKRIIASHKSEHGRRV